MQAQRRRYLSVASLLLAGLLVRAVIFHDVAVNGDTGLYLYDAKQLLWGQQIMVDFPSRSPLMEYALAVVIWLTDRPLVGARMFMAGVSLAAGFAVYLLAREMHSHRAGLLAMGLYVLGPFPMVWGLWVKTEPVAELVALVTVFVLWRHRDRERLSLKLMGGLGSLAAIGFLIRRVWVVHIGVIGLFLVWYRYREFGQLRATVAAGTGMAAGFVASLAAIYLAIGGDSTTAAAVANHHAVALLSSDGQGSIGWIAIDRASAVTAADPTTIWGALCQKCGRNTVEVFSRVLLVALPGLLFLLPLVRSHARSASSFIGDWAWPTALSLAVAIPLWATLTGGYYIRAAILVVLLIGVVTVWISPPIPWARLRTWPVAFCLLMLGALLAGYLYRDRIMYPTYFQDLYPWLAVLAGIVGTELIRVIDARPQRLPMMHIGAAVLIIATGVAGGTAYPYQPGGVEDDSDWFTVESVQAYGADIKARTAPEDRVLTAQPLYVVAADRRIAGNLSRRYYIFEGWPDSPARYRIENRLLRQARDGTAAVAIVDDEFARLESDRLNATVRARYCYHPDSIYQQTGGELYTHRTTTSCKP